LGQTSSLSEEEKEKLRQDLLKRKLETLEELKFVKRKLEIIRNSLRILEVVYGD